MKNSGEIAKILNISLPTGYKEYINKIAIELDNNSSEISVREVVLVLISVVHNLTKQKEE